MKKILEDYLWNEISYVNGSELNSQFHRSPRNVIEEMMKNGWINNPKQAYATLDKWIKKGLYNYGCCKDLGCKEKKELIK
jgi:hypothetical protein